MKNGRVNFQKIYTAGICNSSGTYQNATNTVRKNAQIWVKIILDILCTSVDFNIQQISIYKLNKSCSMTWCNGISTVQRQICHFNLFFFRTKIFQKKAQRNVKTQNIFKKRTITNKKIIILFLRLFIVQNYYIVY